ncbi:DUF2752 domain-containing protein [Capnocytophaga ochracea]|uniref:DUF2752 domain-containing protein n=1 Tax=Capnocytophaga ochracea TaxID=1018 RepID=UPI00222EB60F|nr:DUF2752 domain-containing protein [Capnocytophaga ochracea]UZD38416.1 DUF2752 domain-containing protein [Capnocytophaga ochracea]
MTTKKFYTFITLLCLACWGWLLSHYVFHGQDIGVTVCAIKNITGYPCPSCGTTRSVEAFFEGHWGEALLTNPLGVLASVLLIITPLWLLYDLCRKKTTLQGAYIKFEQFFKHPYVYIPFFILIVLNWIWNIYKGL